MSKGRAPVRVLSSSLPGRAGQPPARLHRGIMRKPGIEEEEKWNRREGRAAPTVLVGALIKYYLIGRLSSRLTIIFSDLVEMLKIGPSVLYNSNMAVMIVNRIKDLRASKSLSQRDLGVLLNCTDVTVSRYESGARDIDSETICRLCEIFGCTADYLLGRSELPTPELNEEEARLLQAYRRGDDRARDMVRLALAPFSSDAGSSATA